MAQPVDRPSSLAAGERSGSATATLRSLGERYAQVRAATLALVADLSEADANLQSMPDASPAKWHMAHTTWFFETFVLEAAEPDFAPFEPSYRVLFNSYYNSVGEQYPRPDRGLISRPSLREVRDYRDAVDQRVLALLESSVGAADQRGTRAILATLAILELGLHHEQQHQELILTDLKHAFSKNPALPAYRRPLPARDAAASELRWKRFDEGLVRIGDGDEGRAFAFDNERPSHRVFLEAFELASRTVTNAEWREFMDDGGYSTPTLWLSNGWAWLAESGRTAPGYWRDDDSGWQQFTLGGLQPIRDDAPVCHVSYYEADAFAAWAGARLPREAEWEIAARDADARGGNFVEAGYLNPQQLSAHDSSNELVGLLGNVWEWTASPYVAYPGYHPAPGALGEYNGKFMADQWVLRGGSCATPASHIRPSYRNFFAAQTRWQFAGVRLARDLGR